MPPAMDWRPVQGLPRLNVKHSKINHVDNGWMDFNQV